MKFALKYYMMKGRQRDYGLVANTYPIYSRIASCRLLSNVPVLAKENNAGICETSIGIASQVTDFYNDKMSEEKNKIRRKGSRPSLQLGSHLSL